MKGTRAEVLAQYVYRFAFDNGCNDSLRTGIFLNFRVRFVSDSSTPSRSRLDAPTKPTQSVCSLM
jgi:hypothetical protein